MERIDLLILLGKFLDYVISCMDDLTWVIEGFGGVIVGFGVLFPYIAVTLIIGYICYWLHLHFQKDSKRPPITGVDDTLKHKVDDLKSNE